MGEERWPEVTEQGEGRAISDRAVRTVCITVVVVLLVLSAVGLVSYAMCLNPAKAPEILAGLAVFSGFAVIMGGISYGIAHS